MFMGLVQENALTVSAPDGPGTLSVVKTQRRDMDSSLLDFVSFLYCKYIKKIDQEETHKILLKLISK